jgi:predicted nucleic acid-binding protein
MYNAGMEKKIKRVYVDNSVVSGMFDDHLPERVEQTRRFWQAVINGEIRVIASDVLRNELDDAPMHVREFFDNLPELQIERVVSTNVSDRLAVQYIAENVIGASSLDDCRHIAVATLFNADAIVSWNLTDMVNRHEKYNSVNKMVGYAELEIVTPNKFMETYHGNT